MPFFYKNIAIAVTYLSCLYLCLKSVLNFSLYSFWWDRGYTEKHINQKRERSPPSRNQQELEKKKKKERKRRPENSSRLFLQSLSPRFLHQSITTFVHIYHELQFELLAKRLCRFAVGIVSWNWKLSECSNHVLGWIWIFFVQKT